MNAANEGEPAVHQETVGRDSDMKRKGALSRKALENAVEEKRHEIACVHKLLEETMRSAEEFNERSDFEIVLHDLQGILEELRMKIEELRSL